MTEFIIHILSVQQTFVINFVSGVQNEMRHSASHILSFAVHLVQLGDGAGKRQIKVSLQSNLLGAETE